MTPTFARIGFVIALTVEQLASAPVVFRGVAEDNVVEAVSMSPAGQTAVFWCDGLHGRLAHCFSKVGAAEPVRLFTGGAIDEADAAIAAPFRSIRHFSMKRGGIGWSDGTPALAAACHTGALSGVCTQSLDRPPLFFAGNGSPLDAEAAMAGTTAFWSEIDAGGARFRAGERTIDLCCATDNAAFAVAPVAGGDMLLVYAAVWRGRADLRCAVIGSDLRVQKEMIVARDIVAPASIAAATVNGHPAVIWSGGGIFAANGGRVLKLSDTGSAPAIATDGWRVVVAWLDHDAVMAAELQETTIGRSLLAIRASTTDPFLALDWSAPTGFVAQWRTQSRSRAQITIASRGVFGD